VGFDPIEVQPNGKGGFNYDKWELLELSIVAVPANPGATVRRAARRRPTATRPRPTRTTSFPSTPRA
jgi:hypothetical protein